MTNALALPLAADREPWARQPRERERAWLAFQDFLAMEPPRNVVKLAKETGRPISVMYQWSSRWHWLERSVHYDGMVQRGKDEALVEQRREMNERHATLARAMSGKVAQRIQALTPEELSPGEVGRWMQVISMVERLALGEATERVDRGGTPDTVVNVVGTNVEQGIVLSDDDVGDILDRLRALGIAADAGHASGNGDAPVVQIHPRPSLPGADDVPTDPAT